MANLLLENKCYSCGETDEAMLCISGPHIMQYCQHCGMYKKFVSIHDLPELKDVRSKIWEVTNQDLRLINIQKEAMCYIEEIQSYKLRFLQTWQLYINIKKSMAYLAK